MEGKCGTLITIIRELLESKEFLEIGRLKAAAFTRVRKLSFLCIIGIILNCITRTIQIEIYDYFEYVLGREEVNVTKKAFSKARQNLNPEVFRLLSDRCVENYYNDGAFDRYEGYRLLAVDGTSIELANHKRLKEVFGHVGNKRQTVRAYASILYDLLGRVVITSEIGSYRKDERSYAWMHLKKLKKSGYKNDLILYDRGYPSRELMAYHIDEGIQFLMRCKNSFMDRRHQYHGDNDSTIQFTHKGREYAVRKVEFLLDSGEQEVLVTSLMDLSIERLKSLYAMRWGIETEYDILKNSLQIENFSGYTPLSIMQDFYAGIALNNIASTLIYDNTHIIDKETSNPALNTSDSSNDNANATPSKEVFVDEPHMDEHLSQTEKAKPLKYRYQTNRNELFGLLKHRLMRMIMVDNPQERVRIFLVIMERMRRNRVPIRQNRNPSRTESGNAIKYPPNRRKSI